jgi:hypothetical protein
MRAYLLLKRHGQEICKRARAEVWGVPDPGNCGYFARLPA